MRQKRSSLLRLTSVLATAALMTGGLFITMAAPASAEAPVPATVSPIAAKTTAQVTADALPTVQIDGIVWAQAVVGTGNNGVVYAGGSFANARPAGAAVGTNQTPRANLLAYNIATGALITTFAPVLNGQVLAMATSPDGTRLFIGGDFTTVDGVTHNRLAEFSTATGKIVATFTPNVGGRIKAITATNTAVYVGGTFGAGNGVTRTRLAAFNVTNGALLDWAPTADYNVNALVMSPDKANVYIGGAFQNVNGSPAYGLAEVDSTIGSLIPWAAGGTVKDAGTQSAILSLSTDGTSIFGTGYTFGAGGNLEGAFSADVATGQVNWVEDCHGDTYGAFPMGGALYTVSHAHYCQNIGGYFQSDPWGVNMRHALAFTTNATGTIQHDTEGYTDWYGHSSPSLINWFPDMTTANVSGATQAAWSVAGNGTYLVLGGEFPTVNGVGQQGLVRFAVKPTAPAKSGPVLTGAHAAPSLVSLSPGTVRVGIPSNWDRDDKTITYKVVRNSVVASPVYTVTADSEFWNTPMLGFTDTGLTPGATYKYRLYETDPDGNQVIGDTATITVPLNAPATSQYAKDVLAAGATQYWRFGETSGNAVYDWAGFDDMTTGGTNVTRGDAGAITGDADGSSTFDGSAAFAVDTNRIVGPNVFTESAWFKTATTSGGKIVGFGDANTGNSGNYDRHIYMDNNGIVSFGVYNNGSYTISSLGALNDGNWHQVVGSLSSAGMSFYVDGKLVGTNTGTTIGQAYNGYWRVGGDSSWAGGNYFAGDIDDVAIYPSALSLAQVKQQYVDSGRTYAGINPPADAYGQAVYADSPSLYYRLDETSGTAAVDLSGRGNNGTYNGGVTQGVTSPVTGAGGTAASFNGSDAFVASNGLVAGPSVYSEELWFNTTTTHGGKLIGFGNHNTGTSDNYDRHVYMLDSGQLVFGTYTGQLNTATTDNGYNDGNWHYMVATQGSDGMKLYVDNVLVATNPQTGAQGYNGYWRIGGDTAWGGDGPFFNGTIDEAAVYPTALTTTQIATHFAAGSGVNHPPTGSFTSSVNKLAASFTATGADSDGAVTGYSWDFGDGSTGTGATATHTYASVGTFSVVLTITDNAGATTKITNPVTTVANVAPTASFTSAVNKLAATFTGTGTDSDGTIASYSWDFGDNTAAVTGSAPSHTYAAAGDYTVTLTVTDNDGATGTVSHVVTAVTNAAPTAAFTANPSKHAASFDASASADSDGTIASYAWDFGDGSTGTGVSPTHTYAGAGPFTVVLTVTDNDGATTSVSQVVTLTSNAAPTAAFTANPSKHAASFDASASADTDGTIASYAWDFGDGSTGTGVSPTHTYAGAGPFTVVLTVTDNDGATNSVSHDVALTSNNAPTAAFTSSVSKLKVAFTGTGTDSDGTIAGYSWDFGDNSPAVTDASPSHTYAAAGDYTVTLTVTDNDGATATVTHVVTAVANVAPTASVAASVSGLVVAFTGTGSDVDGTVASYAWDFGDSTTGSGASPSHTYGSAGTYNVVLTVTDNDGATGTASKSVTVAATPVNAVVAADSFTRTATNAWGTATTGGAWTLSGSTALFAVNGAAGTMKMASAGAGPAAYLNSVSGANVNGTVDVTLSSAPTGGGTYISLAGRHSGTSDYRVRVRFQPTSTTIAIDKLLNGTETALKSATISGLTYNAGDTIRIRLSISGSSPATISAKAWKTSAAEPAAFQVSTTDSEASLQGAGGVGLTSYLSGSSTAPVTATYDNLTFSTTGGVAANVAPTAAFTASPSKHAASFDASASSDSDGTISSYAWDFGDGSTGTGVNPTHTYAGAGPFTVALTVTDNSGATNTVSHVVNLTANVAPTASVAASVSGLVVAFTGTGSDVDGTVASYAWDFGDSTTGSGASPSHTYGSAGTYNVVLTVTDNDGATGTASKSVTVAATPVNAVVAADSFTRTATNAWGTATTGGAWTLSGSTALFAVNGAAGTMKMASAGAGPAAYLNSVSGANVNGTVDVTLSSAPTGGGTYISLAGRHSGTSDYRVRVRFQPTSTTIAIDKLLNGTETALKSATISGLTYNAGDTIRIRLSISGSSPATISAKAWKTSAAEPAAFQVSTTDSEASLQGAGGVGLTSYLSGSSTAPVTATYDNLTFSTQ